MFLITYVHTYEKVQIMNIFPIVSQELATIDSLYFTFVASKREKNMHSKLLYQ